MLNPDRDTRNNIKKVGKGLKVIKAISNTLGTSPTETPDVDTKLEKGYGDDDGAPKIQPSNKKYVTDENGIGNLENDKPKAKSRIGNITRKKKPQAY